MNIEKMTIQKHTNSSAINVVYCMLIKVPIVNTILTNIKFTCGQCHYKGTTKQNLGKHIESAHNNVTFQCETCSKPFKYATNLQKHKRNNEKCSN